MQTDLLGRLQAQALYVWQNYDVYIIAVVVLLVLRWVWRDLLGQRRRD